MSPKISSAEWEVMDVLWSRGSATAAEVFSALPSGHGWATKTVNTFLTRLVKKGAVAVKKIGNVNSYSARVRRDDVVADEGRSFLQRIFKGAAGPLMLHFAERADLSGDDIQKIEALLKAKKRK